MTESPKPLDVGMAAVPPERAAGAPAAVDVSPESIAALVAAGTQFLTAHRADEGEPGTLSDSEAISLLVGLTHDLRSPLGSMLMLLERLRAGAAGPLTPMQERQLALVYSAAFGMASLTNDAFDLARGQQMITATPPGAFEVHDVVAQVRAVVQPIAEEKGLRLLMACAPVGFRIGNAAVVQRVLLNLVTNALKYTSSGSVTVEVTERDASVIRFTVSDSGTGLPAATLAALHSTAVGAGQVPSGGVSTEGAFSSSGLGIALCVALLRHCSSRLVYEAGVPSGSRFSFDLHLPHARSAQ